MCKRDRTPPVVIRVRTTCELFLLNHDKATTALAQAFEIMELIRIVGKKVNSTLLYSVEESAERNVRPK